MILICKSSSQSNRRGLRSESDRQFTPGEVQEIHEGVGNPPYIGGFPSIRSATSHGEPIRPPSVMRGQIPRSRSNRKWHGARRDRRASMMECHSRPGTDWPRIVRSVESCAREGKSMKWPKGFEPKRTAGSSKNRAKWSRSAIEVLQAQINGRELVNGLNLQRSWSVKLPNGPRPDGEAVVNAARLADQSQSIGDTIVQ